MLHSISKDGIINRIQLYRGSRKANGVSPHTQTGVRLLKQLSKG